MDLYYHIIIYDLQIKTLLEDGIFISFLVFIYYHKVNKELIYLCWCINKNLSMHLQE